ncbi:hypothetical protein GCM10009863_05000 [Streptomyces axinellae]|uniref:Uncharacterized protein n=1 Tax=Streptomyces axinellae TaxID=552788 RepID=A0ABN3PNF2_9ACTN
MDTHPGAAASTEVLRCTAFSADPDGGNPAGVVLDASALDDAARLAVAAEVGYSETAFLTPAPEGAEGVPEGAPEGRAFTTRYFSPLDEVALGAPPGRRPGEDTRRSRRPWRWASA